MTPGSPNWDRVPIELKRLRQWLLWRYETRNDRPTKVPYQTDGRRADSTDPATWCSYKDACSALVKNAAQFAGIGFVFTKGDPYCGVDLDHALNEDGILKPWAAKIPPHFHGAYAEISPSALGVKIWVKGKLPGAGKQVKIGEQGARVEMYDQGRFFTVTGQVFGDPVEVIAEKQAAITRLYQFIIQTQQKRKQRAQQESSSNGPREKITEPNRHPELVSEAGRLAGLNGGDVEKTFEGLLKFRDERCDNPQEKTDQELREIAEWVCAREQEKAKLEAAAHPGEKKPSQVNQLIKLASGEGVELFHSPDGDAYASVAANGHRENWLVRSTGFKNWLLHRFLQAYGKGTGSQALNDACNTIVAKAKYEGVEHQVFTRIGELDDSIYLDLGNEGWQAVSVNKQGWEVVDEPPIRFARRRGMLPLPIPESGYGLASLREFVNVGSDADWILLLAWLVMAFHPRGPYPVLALHGEQGSAKSTTARALRELVDPNRAALRSEPREERDLIIAASNGWVINLDNISRLPWWLSDGLCRLSTGAGFGTRELYTDAEEVLFAGARPVVINGIEELATRGDLLDRAVILYLPKVRDVRPEDEFWNAFKQARPRLLAAVLDCVTTALRNLPNVQIESSPRMADFAKWATAAEPAFGCDKGAFLAAYTENRGSANALALEASPVAEILGELVTLKVAADGTKPFAPFAGTATDLLRILNGRAAERVQRMKSWPKDGRALSNVLRRLTPNLRAIGIDVNSPKRPEWIHGKKQRVIRITLRKTAKP
ncbi:MAG: hypothetical protein ACLQVN_06530 [Bryobacteraceae bacterium]